MMDTVARQEVKERCMQMLSSVGADANLCQFYADVMQCEYDMTHATYRMQKELSDEFTKKPPECASLFAIMQGLSKKFYHWKCCIAALSEQGSHIQPLKLSADKMNQAQMLKALCSLETNEMNLLEGDDLVVTDATCPDQLKVRTPRGEEGYVPALCCILPTPDCNANNAVERLQVHLLTSWTECTRRVKTLFFEYMQSICQFLCNTWNNSQQIRVVHLKDRDRVRRRFQRLFDAAMVRPQGLDMSRLHSSLFSLEKELSTLQYGDLTQLIYDVANVDKAVLCCQNFHRQYRLYRDSLKDAPRPIHIVQRLEHLRQLAQGKNFKYYEMKMTLDDVEVTEETTYIPATNKSPLSPTSRRTPSRLSSSSIESTPSTTTQQRRRGRLISADSANVEQHELASEETGTTPVLPGGVTAKHEAVSTEQLTTAEGEERQRIVVKAVRDPRPSSEAGNGGELGPGRLTMEEAVKAGVLVPSRGVYRNPSTGEEQPIAAAMSSGIIEVDYVSTRRTAEKTRAIGLITIRTEIDRREFTLTGAIDSFTAQRIDVDEARSRRILVESENAEGGGYYVIETTGERMSLTAAIDAGWVFAKYDDLPENIPPEVEIHTYAVTEVFDPLTNVEVSFADAVRRGIIDSETGDYVDRRYPGRHESIPVADAIARGLLRARLVDDTDAEFGLKGSRAADRKSAVVVQRIAKIRRHVLKGLRVINAFKNTVSTTKYDEERGEGEKTNGVVNGSADAKVNGAQA